jgi:hypothetical protein
MREHFLSMQMGLTNVVFGLAMAILVMSWPGLSDPKDYGLFFATFVVLMHWHFGASFVLHHLGPSMRLGQTLWDSLMLFAMLGIAFALKNPRLWFALNAAAYLLAWIKYNRLPLESLSTQVSHYVRRKMRVELGAAALAIFGVAWCWLFPSQGILPCWSSLLLNLAAAYVLPEMWRLYHVES